MKRTVVKTSQGNHNDLPVLTAPVERTVSAGHGKEKEFSWTLWTGTSGTVLRTRPATQSITPSSTAAHTMLWFGFTVLGNVIETHEHNGDFKEPW